MIDPQITRLVEQNCRAQQLISKPTGQQPGRATRSHESAADLADRRARAADDTTTRT